MSQLKNDNSYTSIGKSGTPFHQLSSCFISGVDDNLWSIYDVNSKFSRVSKHGRALGIYLGKFVHWTPISAVSKTPLVALFLGSVYTMIQLFAVDQLGKRKAAPHVTLDIRHKDFYEFVELRTNNGDDRRKAHDIFPAISVPNIFMERMIGRETSPSSTSWIWL